MFFSLISLQALTLKETEYWGKMRDLQSKFGWRKIYLRNKYEYAENKRNKYKNTRTNTKGALDLEAEDSELRSGDHAENKEKKKCNGRTRSGSRKYESSDSRTHDYSGNGRSKIKAFSK